MDTMKPDNAAPPRDNLVRAFAPGIGYEVRDVVDGEASIPTLVGHFAVFDQWTEINSMYEGHFLERNAPGAFSKSIANDRARMQVTFNHGRDPSLGDQVLGDIAELREDATGAAYEVPLFKGIPELIMEGLRAGKYGASYRFQVEAEDWIDEPGRSAYNPDGIPERTVREARVSEFGPVTYPAYPGATAGVRSMTDEYVFGTFTTDAKRLSELIDYVRSREPERDAAVESDHVETPPEAPAPSKPKRVPPKRDYLQQEDPPWKL